MNRFNLGSMQELPARDVRASSSQDSLHRQNKRAPIWGSFVLGEGMGFRTLFDQSAIADWRGARAAGDSIPPRSGKLGRSECNERLNPTYSFSSAN